MDNYDLVNFEGDGDLPASNPDLDKPIPFDDSDPGPSVSASNGVSRQPLSLGGASAAAKPMPKPSPQPATPRPAARPATTAPKPAVASSARQPGPASAAAGVTDGIRGVKTFFTKLHPGAIVFLDEQIENWLKEHPDVIIKRTNITTGEVQSKKTEPNLIVMVWY